MGKQLLKALEIALLGGREEAGRELLALLAAGSKRAPLRHVAAGAGRELAGVLLAGADDLRSTHSHPRRTDHRAHHERARVLKALLKTSPRALSAEKLLEQAWDENVDPFTNTVMVHIARLRQKLGDPDAILTIPGIGYRIGKTS